MKTFVDIALLSIIDKELSVLLIKRNNDPFKGDWALPGGKIEEHLSIADSAELRLEERTGISDIYLEQLFTFGDLGRDPRGRSFSISYLALVDYKKAKAIKTPLTQDVQWFKLSELPKTAFDHRKIIKMSKDRMINKISYTRVGFDLVGKEFTLKELVETFESVIGSKIDPSNLKKKLLRLNVISETRRQVSKGVGRPSPIYIIHRAALEALPKTECLFKTR